MDCRCRQREHSAGIIYQQSANVGRGWQRFRACDCAERQAGVAAWFFSTKPSVGPRGTIMKSLRAGYHETVAGNLREVHLARVSKVHGALILVTNVPLQAPSSELRPCVVGSQHLSKHLLVSNTRRSPMRSEGGLHVAGRGGPSHTTQQNTSTPSRP